MVWDGSAPEENTKGAREGGPEEGRGVVFVTGPPGPRKTRAPCPTPRPTPLNGPGQGMFF